jgi:hypothetical protein
LRAKKVAAGTVAIIALISSTAGADTARFTDPDDTPGKLDVKVVRHAHDGRRLLHILRTYARWPSRTLSGDESYIGFYLDAGTKGTRADRFVWVRYKEGRGLYAQIFRPQSHANGDLLGPVRVSRPSRRSVRIALRPSQISNGIANGYRWRVTTSFEKSTTGGPCGEDREVSSFPTGRCIDNVPGVRERGFRHDL